MELTRSNFNQYATLYVLLFYFYCNSHRKNEEIPLIDVSDNTGITSGSTDAEPRLPI